MLDDDAAPEGPLVRIPRRKALGLIGGVGLGVLATACGTKSPPSAAPSSAATRSSTAGPGASPSATGGAATCTLAAELTEGPYYINLNLIRSDITEGKAGTSLKLVATVQDAGTCKPIQNAALDVWHCDAGGVYSGYGAASTGGGAPGGGASPTDKLTFLRGIQMTDAQGVATIQTIYPGWYRGRAVHIHVKVHVGSNVVHTGQLFFPDDLTDQVYQASPYASRGSRDTRNSADSIYQSGGAAGIPTLTPSGSGYVAAITLGVKQA